MEMNIHEAKTHFSRLLRRVEAGEEVTIARAGKPIAKVSAIGPPNGRRPMGMDRGKIWIADDFDAPLPDDILKAFYGGELPKLERAKTNRRKRK
jgi:antitoxin (DNA-binding transcriptional repressor) of toxin-antitoxin stability system